MWYPFLVTVPKSAEEFNHDSVQISKRRFSDRRFFIPIGSNTPELVADPDLLAMSLSNGSAAPAFSVDATVLSLCSTAKTDGRVTRSPIASTNQECPAAASAVDEVESLLRGSLLVAGDLRAPIDGSGIYGRSEIARLLTLPGRDYGPIFKIVTIPGF